MLLNRYGGSHEITCSVPLIICGYVGILKNQLKREKNNNFYNLTDKNPDGNKTFSAGTKNGSE